MKGYIKIHRKIMESWIYGTHRKGKNSQPFTFFESWIDLLLQAHFTDGEICYSNHKMLVTRGSLVTSLRDLGDRFRWNKNKVVNYLQNLKTAGMIEFYSDKNSTTIIILNYDKYQGNSMGQSNNNESNDYEGVRDTSGTVNGTVNGTATGQLNDYYSTSSKDVRDSNMKKNRDSRGTYKKEEEEIYIQDFEKYQWDGMPSNQMEAIRGLCRHISGELPDLLTWRKPLTIHELIRLCEKYTLSRVSDKLEEMANNKGAEKRYSSVYLTCNNWLKRPPK